MRLKEKKKLNDLQIARLLPRRLFALNLVNSSYFVCDYVCMCVLSFLNLFQTKIKITRTNYFFFSYYYYCYYYYYYNFLNMNHWKETKFIFGMRFFFGHNCGNPLLLLFIFSFVTNSHNFFSQFEQWFILVQFCDWIFENILLNLNFRK